MLSFSWEIPSVLWWQVKIFFSFDFSLLTDIMSFFGIYFIMSYVLILEIFLLLVDLFLNISEIIELWWNIEQVLLAYGTVCVDSLLTLGLCLHRVRGSGLETSPRLWMMSLNNLIFLISCALPCGKSYQNLPHPQSTWAPLYAQCCELSCKDKVPFFHNIELKNRPFSLRSSTGTTFPRGHSVKPCSKLLAE